MSRRLCRGSRILALLAVLATAPTFQGCFILDAAVDQAAAETGNAIAASMTASIRGPMLKGYALGLFAAYFWAGGFWLAQQPYQPGEWTMWQHTVVAGGENRAQQPLKVEKAFLHRNADGSEWWRIKAFGENAEDIIVLEALFSADHTQIVRLLARVGQDPVSQVEFAEGENAIPSPNTMTDEWINSHLAGEVQLATGTLQVSARHIRFTSADGSSEANFYLAPGVPGGLVKYEFTSSDGSRYTVAMIGHGNGAATELGAY